MRNLFLTFIALILTVTQLNAQVDSIAIATTKIKAINDSTYTVQVHIQVEKGWKVYDANAEGVEAPILKYSLETADTKNKPQYSVASIAGKDILFNEAKSFPGSFDSQKSLCYMVFNPTV